MITMSFCHNCGKENEDSSNFCMYCGTKLIKNSIRCIKCGEINEYDSNFCINCGNKLNEINKPNREEFEKQVEKMKKDNDATDFTVVSIDGEGIGNHKIEKENPNLGKRNVKFKSIDYGWDIGKDLNEKLDDLIIENYGTPDEKAELNQKNKLKSIKRQQKDNLYEKFHEASDLYFNQEYQNAIGLFKEIVDNGEIYDETVSLAYSSLKDCYEAIGDYNSAISIVTEHYKVKKEFGLDGGDLKKEIDDIKKSEISSKCKEIKKNAVSNYYNGEFDEAKTLFMKCANLGYDDGQTYNLLASIHIRNKDFESAKEALEKGVENVSWENSIHNEYGTGLEDRLSNINDYLETGILKGESLPHDSEPVKSEIKIAKQILKEEDKEKGVELLENIIKNGTYSNTAYYTLYQTYIKDKKYDDAIRISELAIENLGLFDKDRLEKWTKYKDKSISKKEKEISK